MRTKKMKMDLIKKEMENLEKIRNVLLIGDTDISKSIVRIIIEESEKIGYAKAVLYNFKIKSWGSF